jgi:crotonobetainyl-CoA:carnitine CoA-transferase CaiB-like acyl-CoA transferase
MGADVIRVEQPGEIAKQDAVFGHQGMDQKFRKKIRAHEYLSRNKRSLLLNLKEEQSRSIVYKLAERSDVFIEDYRPGIMKKMGLDYENIKEINPGIVYCSISLCGQDGPYRDLPGHDPIALALSGVLSHRIRKNHPSPVPP